MQKCMKASVWMLLGENYIFWIIVNIGATGATTSMQHAILRHLINDIIFVHGIRLGSRVSHLCVTSRMFYSFVYDVLVWQLARCIQRYLSFIFSFFKAIIHLRSEWLLAWSSNRTRSSELQIIKHIILR